MRGCCSGPIAGKCTIPERGCVHSAWPKWVYFDLGRKGVPYLGGFYTEPALYLKFTAHTNGGCQYPSERGVLYLGYVGGRCRTWDKGVYSTVHCTVPVRCFYIVPGKDGHTVSARGGVMYHST